MIKRGDTVFVKTDDDSINKMKEYLTNDSIIRYIKDNPDELYKVTYEVGEGVVLSEFVNMESRYIPIECVELVQNQALYQIRKESIRF